MQPLGFDTVKSKHNTGEIFSLAAGETCFSFKSLAPKYCNCHLAHFTKAHLKAHLEAKRTTPATSYTPSLLVAANQAI
jgi:hypothetical protein